MKYRTFVSASQPSAPFQPPHQQPYSGDGQGGHAPSFVPNMNGHRPDGQLPVHRMPPVVQFLAAVDPSLSRYLTNVALQAYLRGADAHAICDEVYGMALRLGYMAVINTQDVYAAGMPSFPGQRILTTLVMVDLQPA